MNENKWIENYNKNFNSTNSIEPTYSERITQLVRDFNITEPNYLRKTGLEHKSYERFRRGDVPKLKKLILICVIFEIDMQTLVGLLRSLGRTFNLTNPVHYAYYKLVEDYKGHNVNECNDLLKKIGITENKNLLPDPINGIK